MIMFAQTRITKVGPNSFKTEGNMQPKAVMSNLTRTNRMMNPITAIIAIKIPFNMVVFFLDDAKLQHVYERLVRNIWKSY